MKRLTVLLFALLLFSCKLSHHSFNPEARKLNDSAVKIMTESPFLFKGDSSLKDKINTSAKSSDIKQNKDQSIVEPPVMSYVSQYKKAVDLLDKATQIDTDYFIAYCNKIGPQSYLKRYKDALITGKEMIRLAPNDATVKYIVGGIYYKTGDTIRARAYYKEYLSYCDKKLDTMSVKNRHYNDTELQKGLVLILLDQQEKGREIFKKLYQEANEWDKNTYLLYMRATKADLIEGKELTMTVGNTTTSIHL